MTLRAGWQVRCAVCDKVAEPTGRGTVDIEHDLARHAEMASTATQSGEEGRPASRRNVEL
jgi:hypothetical protein